MANSGYIEDDDITDFPPINVSFNDDELRDLLDSDGALLQATPAHASTGSESESADPVIEHPLNTGSSDVEDVRT